MKRRRFSQYIISLTFLPLVGCDFSSENKNTISSTKEVVRALSEHDFYGVEILKMLNPDLSGIQLGIEQLESEYPQLFSAKNKNDLILKVDELIQNDFTINDYTLIKRHMFSRLEVIIYSLSLV